MCVCSHQMDYNTDCFCDYFLFLIILIFAIETYWCLSSQIWKFQAWLWCPPQLPAKGKSHEDAPFPRCVSGHCNWEMFWFGLVRLNNVLHTLRVARSVYKHVVTADVDFRFQTISSSSHWNDCQWFDQEDKLIKIGRYRPRHHDQDDF